MFAANVRSNEFIACAQILFPEASFPTMSFPTIQIHPQAQRVAGRRSVNPHAGAWPLLSEGAPAASGSCSLLSEDRCWVYADCYDLDGRSPHFAGVSCVPRRAVDVPL